MKHSHQAGWAPPEIYAFADSVLTGGVPLPALGPVRIAAGRATASVKTDVGLEKASIVYTTDSGVWKDREWKVSSAEIGPGGFPPSFLVRVAWSSFSMSRIPAV